MSAVVSRCGVTVTPSGQIALKRYQSVPVRNKNWMMDGQMDRISGETSNCCPFSSVTVDKTDYMVGSYGPRDAEYDFLTSLEETPTGLMARGQYSIKSKFTDDDKHDLLSWEWNLNIKKDWTD